jgi:hypothetical protein
MDDRGASADHPSMLSTRAGMPATEDSRPERPPALGPGVARATEARAAFVRAAMRDDRLRLVAQPIVDLRTAAERYRLAVE